MKSSHTDPSSIASVSVFSCRRDAELVIENPRRYIHRLCKHFSHKVRAQWSDTHGQVGFDMGVTELLVCESGPVSSLVVLCAANSSDALEQIVDTLDRHVHGFAKGKDYSFHWL